MKTGPVRQRQLLDVASRGSMNFDSTVGKIVRPPVQSEILTKAVPVTLTQQILLPLLGGLATVLVCILVLRLHAFLALLLAAVVTGGLTSETARFDFAVRRVGVPVDSLRVRDASEFRQSAPDLQPVAKWQVYNRRAPVGSLYSVGNTANNRQFYRGNESPAVAYEPTDLAVVDHDVRRIETALSISLPERIAIAFGEMTGKIGLLIAFAAIIGKCLLDSGGADRIVRSALRLVGERGAPLAFAVSGFTLSIPVFFDTVFLLMIPLGKALRLRTGRNYLLYVLTIYCGGTMAHSLVPPTPGPLLVAERLHVGIGMMILVGGGVGLLAATVGMAAAFLLNRLVDVPLRESSDLPLADLASNAQRSDHELPPLWLSLAPIFVPVLLIAIDTIAMSLAATPPLWLSDSVVSGIQFALPAISFVGDKHLALAVGLLFAFWLLAFRFGWKSPELGKVTGAALVSGSSIILIIAAGGAFGAMIEQTGVATLIRGLPATGSTAILLIAFGVTTTLRTVQGSATVAMITAVGIFSGVPLPFHPVWLAVAIGCGSKPFSWMTDSGFWVISQMSGMTEGETLRTLTPMSGVMGFSGLLFTLIGAGLWPIR